MRVMTRLRILLICFLLALTCGKAEAALFGGEKKAYDSAAEAFDLGLWDRAEREFAQFVEKYPKSDRLAEAILWEAQAQFQQKKFASVVALLTAREADAGNLAAEYLFWVAGAEFQNGNHQAAAVNFGKLAREFPSSPRRLEAAVGEAAAEARMGDWGTVLDLLHKPEGAFRQSSLGLTNNETVARGHLLKAEAQLADKQYGAAEFTLTKITVEMRGELEWRRRNLLCRALLGLGRPTDALRESTGLLVAAEEVNRRDLLADSVSFRADILEQLGKWDEAIAELDRNLNTNAPTARQEQALSRITSLALKQGQYGMAAEKLQAFLDQSPAPGAASVAQLTLGEILLKQYATTPATNQNGTAAATSTNRLAWAMKSFDRVITVYSNSTLVGRAQLGRGWCYWLEEKYPESALAFAAAVEAMPASEDRVVARFKLADALFLEKEYAAALENYQVAALTATNWPTANAGLRLPALYQSLRASLALTNFSGAEEAVRAILESDPNDPTAARSLLLVAQGHVDASQLMEARPWFEKFVTLFPESDLRPQVELLIARLQEQQSGWTNAIAAYEGWLTRFPSNSLRPRVEFQQALAVARSGDETNALGLFTNFVARYRTNELSPRAQWWVADYYFNRGDFAEAEINFKQLFQNWKTSNLAYDARMMAGRAAMQWSGFPNAIEYFTGLTSDTNCPPELWAGAVLAYGSVKMRLAPAETNRLAGYAEALKVYGQIHQRYTTNEFAALAWGEIGNCYLQMAALDPKNYESASNAFQKVISMPAAGPAARSQAQCGLGIIQEKLAETASGEERKALLLRARDLYLDVALEKNLRELETADEFWVKESGLKALRLLELMQGWPTQDQDTIIVFCRKMQGVLPVLNARFEIIISRSRNPVPPEKS